MHSIHDKLSARIRQRRASLGFTLLELMIVITIILILLSLGASKYTTSITQAKEAKLKQTLFAMRQAIDNYTKDNQQAPQSLDELVSAGYLRSIPVDPFTGRADWRVEYEREPLNPEKNTGISDVRSNSESLSPFDNTRYSEW